MLTLFILIHSNFLLRFKRYNFQPKVDLAQKAFITNNTPTAYKNKLYYLLNLANSNPKIKEISDVLPHLVIVYRKDILPNSLHLRDQNI